MKLVATILALIAITPQDPKSQQDDAVKRHINGLYTEYLTIHKSRTIEQLVTLDWKLRHFMPVTYYDTLGNYRYPPSSNYWKEGFSQMGVEIAYYGEVLLYTGRLLAEAHNKNPHSEFREYTLYSIIVGTGRTMGRDLPNLRAAHDYIKEFPRGPFIGDVYETVADLHKDLYLLFLELEKNGSARKENCFKKFIKKTSYSKQAENHRLQSIDYYTRLLKVRPTHKRAKERVEALKSRNLRREWSYCAD